ncbi:hypothetical protein BGZ73_006515 [Actinomortierella ambigua]|nr:hypothetical protein BGZ73_006515 [Actinomortierella ambigua]
MPASIQCILAVPAIQDAIGQELENADLRHCQLVSRNWHDHFTRLVWGAQTLRIHPEKDFYQAAESQAKLARFGCHVRRLSVPSLSSLQAVMPYFHKITHLIINEQSREDEGTEEDGPWRLYLDRLLETSCRKLESLTVRSLPGISPRELVSLLVQKPDLAQSLRTLVIDQFEEPARSTKVLFDLLVGLPQLTYVQFHLGSEFEIDHDDQLLESCTFRLKTLGLNVGYMCRVSDSIRLRFWRQCPFLSEFEGVENMDANLYEDFVAMFDARDAKGQPVRFPDSLCIPFSHGIPEQDMVRILGGCARERLSELSLSGSSTGPEVFKVLLETQSTTLKFLFMDGATVAGFNSSPWIQRLLTSCPRLTLISSRDSAVDVVSGVHLHADDILSGSWVCSNLTSFSVPIIGIPSAGRVSQENRVAIVDRVMQQIGKMTKLRKFGSMATPFPVANDRIVLNDEGSVLCRTLPFSLSRRRGGGALEHLAGLKKLEELNLWRYATDICMEEAVWMKEQFPKLKGVYGLYRPWDTEAMEANNWLRANGVVVSTKSGLPSSMTYE